jgi:hypothetical protein
MSEVQFIRCNHCMTIMEEYDGKQITACRHCEKDDALMELDEIHDDPEIGLVPGDGKGIK